MIRCVNENCNNDPTNSLNMVVVNVDGDLACCPQCKIEYEKQRDHFLNNIVNDDDKFNEWLGI